METGPVTIGDMRRNGELLHAFCINQLNDGPCHSRYCGHRVYIDPHKVRTRSGNRIPDNFPVPELHWVFRRTKCGVRNGEKGLDMPVTVRGDTRPPKMGL